MGTLPVNETEVGRSMWFTLISISEPALTVKSTVGFPALVDPSRTVAFSLRMTVAVSDSKTRLPDPLSADGADVQDPRELLLG